MSNQNTTRRRRRRRNRNRRRGAGNPTSRTPPVARARRMVVQNPKPQFRLKHREFVSDIRSEGTDFAVVATLPIQPGWPQAFPWLSTIAWNFEGYTFHGLSFRFESALPSITPGTVALVPDFDAADLNIAFTKKQLFQFEDTCRSSCWDSFSLKVSKHNLHFHKHRYVRKGALLPNLDVKTYDLGNLYIIVDGIPEGFVGELWVEYDISLITPQTESELELDRSGQWDFEPITTSSPTNPIAGLQATTQDNLDAVTFSGSDMIIPYPGRYLASVNNKWSPQGGNQFGYMTVAGSSVVGTVVEAVSGLGSADVPDTLSPYTQLFEIIVPAIATLLVPAVVSVGSALYSLSSSSMILSLIDKDVNIHDYHPSSGASNENEDTPTPYAKTVCVGPSTVSYAGFPTTYRDVHSSSGEYVEVGGVLFARGTEMRRVVQDHKEQEEEEDEEYRPSGYTLEECRGISCISCHGSNVSPPKIPAPTGNPRGPVTK